MRKLKERRGKTVDKLFRDIIPMPHLSSDFFEIKKETSDTLIVVGRSYRIEKEYTFYKNLEKYLKENISLKYLVSYLSKGDNVYSVFTRIKVEKREIEVDFIYMLDELEVTYNTKGKDSLSEKEKIAIKDVVVYKEKYLREKSKNRLRYLHIPIFYSDNVQKLLKKSKQVSVKKEGKNIGKTL